MTKAYLSSGKTLDLLPQDVLGTGGEGTVYKVALPSGQVAAVKIYHNFDKTRAKKLESLIKLSLPPEIVAPQELLFDKTGNVVGFAMRLLPAGQQVWDTLAIRKLRETKGVTTANVVDLHISLAKTLTTLHPALVVGDLNPFNEVYRKDQIALIDVDSFQVDKFPCSVAMEQYLTPRLYGVDLGKKPIFTPQDDWYSFLVLFFRSLVLVHPYGGAHPTLRTVPKRALARTWVLDKNVTYPASAYSPEIVSDSLLDVFSKTFSRGYAPTIGNSLEEYKSILIGCPSCGTWYPNTRRKCPECDVANQKAKAVVRIQKKGLTALELFATSGPIVFVKLFDNEIRVLSQEGGKLVYYQKEVLTKVTRSEIFNAYPDAEYDFFANFLVVCQHPYDEEPKLYLLNIETGVAQPVTTTVSNRFGSESAVFRGSKKALFRNVGGVVLRGEIPTGHDLVEAVVANTLPNQTWFDCDPKTGRESVFGFYRVVDRYDWFLVDKNGQNAIPVSALSKGDVLLDRVVRFSDSAILLLRKIKSRTGQLCYIDLIDRQTREVSVARISDLTGNPQFGSIHGITYGQGTMLIPQDTGILAERVDSGSQNLFSEAAGYVDANSTLYPFEDGVVAVTGNKIWKLTLRR